MVALLGRGYQIVVAAGDACCHYGAGSHYWDVYLFLLIMGISVALTDLQRLPLAIGFFILIQVIHNAIILPKLQVRALGLHPVIIVVVLAVFSLWFGILGALVAAASNRRRFSSDPIHP